MGEEYQYLEGNHIKKVKEFKSKFIMEKILYLAIMIGMIILLFVVMIKCIKIENKSTNDIAAVLLIFLINIILIYSVYSMAKELINIIKNGITNIKYGTIKKKYFNSSSSRNSRKPQRTYYVDVILEDGVTAMNKIQSKSKYYRSMSENERVLIVSYDAKKYYLIKL